MRTRALPCARTPRAAKGASGAPEHSTTNVHEAGVDEPDLVKTDGNRVITVNRGVLRVVDAATRKVTGTLQACGHRAGLGSGRPVDQRGPGAGAVLRRRDACPFGAMAKRPASSGPRYVLVDLSGAPKVIGSLTPNGAHVDARMVGSTVRIVVRSQPEINFPDRPGPDLSENERTRRNMDVVAKTPIEAWLPTFEVTAADGTTSKKSVGCEQISHPAEYTGTSMLTVHSLDLSPGVTGIAETAPIGVAADGDTVYGTGSSLYVTSNPRWWWPRPIRTPIIDDARAAAAPPDDRDGAPEGDPGGAGQSESTPSEPPVPVNPTPAPALTKDPGGAPRPPSRLPRPSPPSRGPLPTAPCPRTRRSSRRRRPRSTGSTSRAPGAPRYVASGKVPGWLLNQYSLSEWDGIPARRHHLDRRAEQRPRCTSTCSRPTRWRRSARSAAWARASGSTRCASSAPSATW